MLVIVASCREPKTITHDQPIRTSINPKLLTSIFEKLKDNTANLSEFVGQIMKKFIGRHTVNIKYKMYIGPDGNIVFVPVDKAKNHYFPGK